MATRNMYFALQVQVTDANEDIWQQDEVLQNIYSALVNINMEGLLSPHSPDPDNDEVCPQVSYVKVAIIPPMDMKPFGLCLRFGREMD